MAIFLNKLITTSFRILKENCSLIFRKKSKGSFFHQKGKPKLTSTKIKPNNFYLSYNIKFLKTRRKMLFRRTIAQNYRRNISSSDTAKVYFGYVNNNMIKIQRKVLYKRKFKGNYPPFILFKNRTHDTTRVFVTHCRKNTFVTAFRGHIYRNDNNGFFVIFKTSSGLIGYKGPKKSTVFARKSVIKDAGNSLTNHMTSILDVIFTSNVSRWNRKTVRDLCPNVSYVSKIYITYNRSHGYTKLKTRRRV